MNGENRPDSLTAESPPLEQIGLVWKRMLEERLNKWDFHKILFPKIKNHLTKWRRILRDNLGEACLLSLLLVFERTRTTIFPPIAGSTFSKDLGGARSLGNALGINPITLDQEESLEQMIEVWQGLSRKIPLPPFVMDSSLADFFGGSLRAGGESLGDLIRQYFTRGGQPQEVFTTMACGLQTCLTEQLDRAGSRGR